MIRTGDFIYIDNTKVGEQTIWFDPNPSLVAKMESLENCRFDNENLCWITNYNSKRLEDLIEVFQNESVILASQLLMPIK